MSLSKNSLSKSMATSVPTRVGVSVQGTPSKSVSQAAANIETQLDQLSAERDVLNQAVIDMLASEKTRWYWSIFSLILGILQFVGIGMLAHSIANAQIKMYELSTESRMPQMNLLQAVQVLHMTVEQADTAIAEIQTKIAKNTESMTSTQTAITNGEKALLDAQANLRQAQEYYTSVESTLSNEARTLLQKTVLDAQASVDTKTRELDALRTQLATLQASAAQLTLQLQDAQTAKSDAERELRRYYVQCFAIPKKHMFWIRLSFAMSVIYILANIGKGLVHLSKIMKGMANQRGVFLYTLDIAAIGSLFTIFTIFSPILDPKQTEANVCIPQTSHSLYQLLVASLSIWGFYIVLSMLRGILSKPTSYYLPPQ